MFSERSYAFGSSMLTLQFKDILESSADVLVSSDDFMLTMGGGVSRAIADRAGSALVLDAAKSVPRKLGDVVVTTAGALDARYVFHVVTIGSFNLRERPLDGDVETVVCTATARCLDLMDALDVSSIAFPALGTGAAGFPMEAAAAAMADVVSDRLQSAQRALDISLCFRAVRGIGEGEYITFFEEFAHRRPSIARRETTPVDAPASPPAGSESLGRLLELERERQRLEQNIIALKAENEPAAAAGLSGQLFDNQRERMNFAARERADRGRPVSVFISYAHEDAVFHAKLSAHIADLERQGLITTWHDRKIAAGTEWDSDIHQAIHEAEIVMFLISADFVASEYIREVELVRAFERLDRGDVTVLPVLVRDVDLVGNRLSSLQLLPTGGMPINRWPDEDEAYVSVVRGIREAVATRRARGR